MFTLSFVNENICPCGFSGLTPNPRGTPGDETPWGAISRLVDNPSKVR